MRPSTFAAGCPGCSAEDDDANSACTWVNGAAPAHAAEVQVVKSAPKCAAAKGAVCFGADIEFGITLQTDGACSDGGENDKSADEAPGDAASM
jgi:hypothetical protein